jgi:polysaccharide pyruvyl transferase WcaK-like protein
MQGILTKSKRFLGNWSWLRKQYFRSKLRWNIRQVAAGWADLPASGKSERNPATLIFSRFGTETIGNHFIQLGLLRVAFDVSPTREVFLLSSAIDVTESGIAGILELLSRIPEVNELARFIVEKVSVVGEESIRSLGPGDLLVLGGGPIMDDPALAKWLLWFKWARRAGARVMIAGCGVGPLRETATISMAGSLLGLADVLVIRNKLPKNLVRATRSPLWIALDPAFLCAPILAQLVGPKRSMLAVNARAIGFDSNPDVRVSHDEVIERVLNHALAAAECVDFSEILPFSTQEGTDLPDSAFAVRVARSLGEKLNIPVRPLPETSIPGIVDSLLPAEFVLSTRMHGFIIGLLLGCRAAGIDYIAGNGKCVDLYRDWFGRSASPSLFIPGSLHCEDFVSLSDLEDGENSINGLLNTYAGAMRQALSEGTTS